MRATEPRKVASALVARQLPQAVPSDEQVNLGVSHRFADAPGGPIDLSLDVINVLDKVYEIRNGTGVGVGAPQFGPRRGLFAGLSKEL